MAKPKITRTFNGIQYRLTRVTGNITPKREARKAIKDLRDQGYKARATKSRAFGYLIWSTKPWHKIPW